MRVRQPLIPAAVCTTALLVLATGCGGASTPQAAPTSSAQHSSAAASAQPTAVPSSPLAVVLPTVAEMAAAHGETTVEELAPDGTAIGTSAGGTTLDLCAASAQTYGPSERMRVQRLQVNYVDASTKPARTAASVEVVRYKPGGTNLAFSELTHTVGSCPPSIHVEPSSSGSSVKGLTVTRLIQNGQGTPVYETLVYQYSGDLFAGAYVFAGTMDDSVHAANAIGSVISTKLTAASAHL